jgi:2-polyprenyl-3-methyl-5-hydroxy-6-metoxy-1,4-benzoquinol methylase
MKKQTRKSEWFDNEELWRATYPFIFSEHNFAAAPETVKQALNLAKPKGKSALDLCCGPGRCAVPLSRLGFSVTGVDCTKYLLDEARARARTAESRIEWIHADMRDFIRPESYDLALSMFTSFGYFENRSEDDKVLSNVFTSLRPHGVFLMEIMGKEMLAKIFQPASVESLPDGTMMVEQRQIIDDWTRVRNQWTIIRKAKARKFIFHLNLYSGQELREKLEMSGFRDVKLYGNMDGDPYGPSAKRLIAVARKSGSGVIQNGFSSQARSRKEPA